MFPCWAFKSSLQLQHHGLSIAPSSSVTGFIALINQGQVGQIYFTSVKSLLPGQQQLSLPLALDAWPAQLASYYRLASRLITTLAQLGTLFHCLVYALVRVPGLSSQSKSSTPSRQVCFQFPISLSPQEHQTLTGMQTNTSCLKSFQMSILGVRHMVGIWVSMPRPIISPRSISLLCC